MYEATGKGCKYLMYAVSDRINYMSTTLNSRRSNLSIGIRDKENGNTILGSVIEINNIQYEIDRYKKEILYGIDVGELNAKVISVPDDYILPKEDVKIGISYKENHIENIGIMHKKGNIRVNGNMKKASYDLLDKNRTCIGSYSTENGIVDISNINTGTYYLVQTNVPNGWTWAEEQELEVKYGETTTLEVINEKIEETGKPEEEEKPAIPNKQEAEEILTKTEKTGKAGKTTVLPRTGNDYFILKLILIDLSIFIIFLIIILQRSCNSRRNQKQTTNLKHHYLH